MNLLHPDTVMKLDIRLFPGPDIPAELDREIDALDRAAFAGHNEGREWQWTFPKWMVLGFHAGKLVSQLGLLQREIRVGGEPVQVAGVGSVATDPKWQRRGFASQVLGFAHGWMREELQVPFGLLVCLPATSPVYASCGWQTVSDGLFHHQESGRLWMEICVMVLCLGERQWLEGEIDLCGLPW